MRQDGYSLLLALLVILGLGGVLLTGTAVNFLSHESRQTIELSQARAALISYAVNYIDHYGPRGAGVGHLPCPDTDAPGAALDVNALDVNAAQAELANPWKKDGPNPPCAKNKIEQGWLPRHVNVRDGRYHFHVRTRQRLLYAVSGQFVNNPIGRMVNPSINGDITVGNFSDVVAVLIIPTLESEYNHLTQWTGLEHMLREGAGFALIRTTDIRAQAMRRVGEWLVQQLRDVGLLRCQSVEENARCGFARSAPRACDLVEQHLLMHWLSDVPVSVDCDEYKQTLESTMTTFEDVPIGWHWFFRNEWFRFVDIVVDDGCEQSGHTPCQFALLPSEQSSPSIQIALQPLSLVVAR